MPNTDYTVMKLDGARRLRSTLKRAGVDMTQLKDTHKRVAAIVLATARPLGPVRTGKLIESMRDTSTPASAVVRAGTRYPGRVPYAKVIFYGWEERHIKANPWLGTAAKRSEPTWFSVYNDRIRKIIDGIQGGSSQLRG